MTDAKDSMEPDSGRLLRAGVAGAGVFGSYHANKYADLGETRLAAVYDTDAGAAHTLADHWGAAAFSDFDAFLESIDILSIATPAAFHGSLAARALALGRAVYIEKPIALRADEGERLLNLAESVGAVIAVGHQERVTFNAFERPAGPVRLVEFARMGPASGRCEDVSAVFDLMIHDLDLALALGLGAPVAVAAAGDAHVCAATVTFNSGAEARFLASRRADEARREMRLFAENGQFTLDFIARTAVRDGIAQHPALQIVDPLRESIHSFVKAVQGRGLTLVSGRDGLAALRLATAIETARLSSVSGSHAHEKAFA